MNDHLETYIHLMHEIKRRYLSLRVAYDEPNRLLFKATVIDHCYLQMRKILELVAFSTLSANQYALTAVQIGKSRDYHAEKVLRSIERKFGPVYPRPVKQLMNPIPGIKADLVDLTDGFLTRAEFSILYDECGNVLHGRNPFRKPLDLEEHWSYVPVWTEKIRLLLNTHIATIIKDHNLYLYKWRLTTKSQHIPSLLQIRSRAPKRVAT